MKITKKMIRRLLENEIKSLNEVKGMNLGKTGGGVSTFSVERFIANDLDNLVYKLSDVNPSKDYVENATKQFKTLANKDPAKFKSLMDALLKEPMFSQTTSKTPEALKATIDAQRSNLLSILKSTAPEGVKVPSATPVPASSPTPSRAPAPTSGSGGSRPSNDVLRVFRNNSRKFISSLGEINIPGYRYIKRGPYADHFFHSIDDQGRIVLREFKFQGEAGKGGMKVLTKEQSRAFLNGTSKVPGLKIMSQNVSKKFGESALKQQFDDVFGAAVTTPKAPPTAPTPKTPTGTPKTTGGTGSGPAPKLSTPKGGLDPSKIPTKPTTQATRYLVTAEGQAYKEGMKEQIFKIAPKMPADQLDDGINRILSAQMDDVASEIGKQGMKPGTLAKGLGKQLIGAAALSAAFPYIEAGLLGKPFEDVSAEEVTSSLAMGIITGIGFKLVTKIPGGLPILCAVGVYLVYESLVGDMSDIWQSIKKTAKINVGMTTGGRDRDLILTPGEKGRGIFFVEEDFWQYVDEKYPGKYTNGVLKPKDLDAKRQQKIFDAMLLTKEMRKIPEEKAKLSDIFNGKNLTRDFEQDIKMLNDCFKYGFLDIDAWGEEFKKRYPPQPAPEVVVEGEEEELKPGESQGEEKITEPGEKVTKNFDWDKYIGNDPEGSDKHQIKMLWIKGVAEKTGNKKSFNSWARWYKTLKTTGKIGIGDQQIADGSPIISKGDNRKWKKGRELSPDQVEFIMRKIYKDQEITPEKIDTMKENKVYLNKSTLLKLLRVI